MRWIICSATPGSASAFQPSTTKPQCSGCEKISSVSQKAWPHSLKPRLGRMKTGPSTASTCATEIPRENAGKRVIAYMNPPTLKKM